MWWWVSTMESYESALRKSQQAESARRADLELEVAERTRSEANLRDLTEQLRDAQRRLLLHAAELEVKVEERTRTLYEAEETSRRLSSQLLRSQDEEHRRIARELHDSIGQTLAAASMSLQFVDGLIPKERSREINDLLKQAIQEARN